MLKVKNLNFLYPNGRGICDVNFDLQVGEHLAIIGESGCGKSTLIKAIYGLFDLDEGEVLWNEDRILGPAFNLIPGKESFKYLSQEFDLMPFTSVENNVQKYLSRMHPEANQVRTDELLEVLELTSVKHTKVKNLSGGQKQRVAIGQALAKVPEVLLLDEPFSHIDQFKKNRLRRRLFQYLKSKNITCIFATHDKNDVLPFSDFTLVMQNGKILDFRPTKAVFEMPKNHYSASLFGDVNVLSVSEFGFKSAKAEVLVYPEEIFITTNSEFTGNVEKVYYYGSHFLIQITTQESDFFLRHHEKIQKHEKVNFDFEYQKISKRI
ncbi:ABC transporter ATP-binding protein [Psychroflexus aestuariivivens]|uniref:ABC transporter ATP-binding protein n=1 Tax=Psychroflexus aestuariivivens TaxID=1795040 RepID=UPI000FDAEA69|nr:ABC transporter ATP-binding protein [Psychroflexus aestuariivivens]